MKSRTGSLRRTDNNLGEVGEERDEGADAVGVVAVVVGDEYEWFLRIHNLHFDFRAKVRKKVYKVRLSRIKYVSL